MCENQVESYTICHRSASWNIPKSKDKLPLPHKQLLSFINYGNGPYCLCYLSLLKFRKKMRKPQQLWWNLYVEPGGTWTFQNGTCMRNLAEPGSRFRAAAPNHPGALLEEPQAFQAVGEKKSFPNISVFPKHPTNIQKKKKHPNPPLSTSKGSRSEKCKKTSPRLWGARSEGFEASSRDTKPKPCQSKAANREGKRLGETPKEV